MKLIIFHLRKITAENIYTLAKELEDGFNFKFAGVDSFYKKEEQLVLTGELLGMIVSLRKLESNDQYEFIGNPDYDIIEDLGEFCDISEYLCSYLDSRKVHEWIAIPSKVK